MRWRRWDEALTDAAAAHDDDDDDNIDDDDERWFYRSQTQSRPQQ